MNNILFNFFFSFSQNPMIAGLALFISNILIYILFAVIILFVLFKMKPLFLNAFILGGAGLSAWIISKIIKIIFHIPRPFVTGNFIPLINESGFSMPSVHATVFATLSIVAFSMNRTLGIVFSICALFIGISRIILGVHYPLDIILGFALGVFIGLFFVRIGKHSRLVAFFCKSL